MSEYRWNYYDPSAGRQSVGIFHGDSNGHLLIYHNHQVVLIDFGVTSNKTYTYLANDFLHTFKVRKEESSFHYSLESCLIDRTTEQGDQEKLFNRFFDKLIAGLKFGRKSIKP